MADIKPVWTQFNGGEISPWMEGRIDFAKFPYSAKLMLNNIPISEGAFKRRGGTHFVASCKETEAALLEIVPNPPEALVVINGEEQRMVYCAPGDAVNYTVSATGYQTKNGTITVEEDLSLPVELVSTTKRFTLTVNATPADAVVTINDIVRNTAELLYNSQPSWSVSKEGYGYKSGIVTIKDNMVLNVVLEMRFTIVPNPADAVVTINGVETSSVIVQPGDTVNWSVSRRGYETESGSTTISKTTTEVVNLAVINPNKVILDTGTPGIYKFDVAEDSIFAVEGTGGGSGGYWKTDWNGGSSAVYRGVAVLAAGNYEVVVGNKGYTGTPPSNGTATVIRKNGVEVLNLGGGIWGGGSVAKIKKSFYKELSYQTSSDGTSPGKGNAGTNPNILYGESYGYGGRRNNDGGNGYIKITDNGLFVE